MIKRILVATVLTGIVFFGITACKKSSAYNVEELNYIAASCAQMDRYNCYSFLIRETESGWTFSAECFLSDEEFQTVFEDISVSDEDISELMSIIQQQKQIESLEKYKEPFLKVDVSDGESCYSTIGFKNGDTIEKPCSLCSELITFFYELTEKIIEERGV